MTLGERRIRTDFNISKSGRVETIKSDLAMAIDSVSSLLPFDGEAARLQSIALTKIEEAAMWAVKYFTYKPPVGELK